MDKTTCKGCVYGTLAEVDFGPGKKHHEVVFFGHKFEWDTVTTAYRYKLPTGVWHILWCLALPERREICAWEEGKGPKYGGGCSLKEEDKVK